MPDPTTDPNQVPSPNPAPVAAADATAPAQSAPAQQDQPAQEAPQRSRRFQAREARMKMVRDAATVTKIRVRPAREHQRQLLAHPTAGGFRSSGSVEWPNNTFTKRRIRDGDVVVENREAARQDQSQPSQELPQGLRPNPPINAVQQGGGSGRTQNAAADSAAPAKPA